MALIEALVASAVLGIGLVAGWLAGLERCETPYMVTVPCDTPNFPADLVARFKREYAEAKARICAA